jgi:diguanylate cyclase (GGDEF)-like protein/PAS domain S-box-containing protein
MGQDDGSRVSRTTGPWPPPSEPRRTAALAVEHAELRRLHEALELSTRKYRNLFELAPVGYLFLDAEGAVREANLACAALLGQPRSLLENASAQMLVRSEDRAALEEHLARVAVESPASLQVRVLHSDGRQIPVSVRSVAMRGADGRVVGVHMAFMDVSDHERAQSELKRARDHLHHLAHHDPLTDLPNRLLFRDRLQQAVLRGRRRRRGLALLYVDVDRFKFVNDSMGHQAGDEFLCELARRLRDAVRAEDTVARIGGDEFSVILERMDDMAQAEEVADKLVHTLRKPLVLGEHRIAVSCSIGIALYPTHGDSPESLIRSADAAMFAAKEQGRDRVQRFTETLAQEASSRLLLESELRRALTDGELRLHYQPQYCGRSGAIVGVEALVRWEHPVRGLVPPGKFIPVAEDCGLIPAIGRWVLEEACRQGQAWHTRGHRLRMAVNLSTRQLGLPSLVPDLEQVLHRSGFPADSLELEITEGALTVDAEAAIAQLRALRDLGVHIAIDDFGTGYSSLSRLRRLPISRLKIDGSFVQGIPGNGDDRSIARAIISMAHDLSLEVISEGVETAAQRAFLEDNGCDLLQGFWLGRPQASAQVSRLLDAGFNVSA